MQYTNENILKINGRAEVKRIKIINNVIFHKMKEKIKRHKWLTIIVTVLIVFSTINIVMVYNFMNLLQKLY